MGTVVLQDITKYYGNSCGCRNINLSIKEGEFYTFLGPSGCGKTTILRIIAGFLSPNSGSLLVNGVDITKLAPEKRNIGMVFQNYALFPFMTVIENIQYGLKVQKRSKKEVTFKSEEYIDLVGLTGFEDRSISELSGGEQQRVALARSLAIEPKVLLLDEPLSNLDASLREHMRNEIIELQKKLSITTIFVTHDQKEALTMSDNISVFNDGACLQTAPPEEIYNTPTNSFVASFIGETNLFHAEVKVGKALINNTFQLDIPEDKSGNYISIRPHDIMISRELGENRNTFLGIVQNRQYNGMYCNYRVIIDDITINITSMINSNTTLTFKKGDHVYITFPPTRIHVFQK